MGDVEALTAAGVAAVAFIAGIAAGLLISRRTRLFRLDWRLRLTSLERPAPADELEQEATNDD